VGVDVSEKKIETAGKIARDLDIADRCAFHATDIGAFRPEEKFDLVASIGSLHHLPDLVTELPHILDRTLRPGGHVLFCEPHHEGMVPWFQRLVFWVANWKWYAMLDKELWFEATQPDRVEGMNLRSESPGGLQFLDDDHATVGDAVRAAGVRILEERSFSYLVGDIANVGIVYMRPRLLRGLARLALPAVTELDWLACRVPRFARWAQERIWFGSWEPGQRR
jgi:SAM-dependent methyltransferase